MFNQVSADGYFTAPDDSLDWVVRDPDVQQAGVDAMPKHDAVLFGRKTYEHFVAFWPRVLAGEIPQVTAPMREMAKWLHDVTKIVFSRTLKNPAWHHTRVVGEVDPRAIAAMKAETGKDMILFGSGTIVAQLTRHKLIDDYQFVVSPVLLGRGRTLLGDVPGPLGLQLTEARAFPKSGNVRLSYALPQ
jgi:dihydrofolate reductase